MGNWKGRNRNAETIMLKILGRISKRRHLVSRLRVWAVMICVLISPGHGKIIVTIFYNVRHNNGILFLVKGFVIRIFDFWPFPDDN